MEVAQAQAQGQKKLALAKAEAESNRLVAASISSALISYEKIRKWDGRLPIATGGQSLIDTRSLQAVASPAAKEDGQ